MRFLTAILAASIALSASAGATAAPAAGLVPVFKTGLIFNGIATTTDGRMFVPFQRQMPSHGIEVGEIVGGVPRAFPDGAWNAWSPGKPAARAFVAVNALRIGPDGALWIVDKGASKKDASTLPGGPKVVRVDLATDTVSRVYPLDAVASGKSFVDDIRFNGRHAYLTDAGRPGLIVLDLRTGAARRVLDGDPSTRALRPLTAEGKPLVDPMGKPFTLQADQLEVSPDGRWFYFSPAPARCRASRRAISTTLP